MAQRVNGPVSGRAPGSPSRVRRRTAVELGHLPLLAYGFRPFFLLAAIFAALAVPLWLAAYMGNVALPSPLPPSVWHGHEMLFGYGAAVLAGFLLTATPGWSGRPPVSGAALAALALIWLAGRLLSSAGGAVPALAAAVDLAFLPALALAITPALQAAPARNRIFLPVLGMLLLANLGVHLDALDVLPGLGEIALRVTLDLFALLIALIGGRVVPAFTGNALAARGEAERVRTASMRDRLAIGALVLLLLADLGGFSRAAGGIALAAALLNAWRLHGWQGSRTLREPTLSVLHLGYLWLAIGLAWKGMVQLSGFLPPADALHGLAIGAVGTMTLAIMSRATLGHTGRPLHAPPLVVASYLLVGAAALARLAAPLAPAHAISLLVIAVAFWTLAFAAFAICLRPALIQPRIDGRPG
jgi:uncharacterized protein involved in response to NO